MSDPNSRLNPVRVSVVGLILLLVFVVLIRAPSDAPNAPNTGETAAAGPPADPTAGVNGDSARQAPGGVAAGIPAEAEGPPLTGGCFRLGSSRDQVRAVMGAPDTIAFGDWVYGQSTLTFAYGQVDYVSNDGGNLRLC